MRTCTAFGWQAPRYHRVPIVAGWKRRVWSLRYPFRWRCGAGTGRRGLMERLAFAVVNTEAMMAAVNRYGQSCSVSGTGGRASPWPSSGISGKCSGN